MSYLIKYVLITLSFLTLTSCDSNSKMKYGKTGLPKNCRAIITANIDGWRAHEFSAEDALLSIERNCGENGYAW